jgi:hypothetical protein
MGGKEVMNFDVLAPTIASLLFAALSLLIIFLLTGVNWTRTAHYVRVALDQMPKEHRQVMRVIGRMLYLYVMILIGTMR